MTNAALLDRELLTRYSKLQTQGEKPGVGLVLTALKSCRDLKDVEFGARIHRDVVATGDISNFFVANTLLDMYVKNGSLDAARSLFEDMKERSVVSWTAMIMGYAHNDQAEIALELYERMQEEDCEPDRVTFLAALKACSVLAKKARGQLRDGKWSQYQCLAAAKRLYSQACQGGIQMDTSVGNSLIDLFAKCGSLSDARRHFDCMQKRNIVSWNCIILACAQNGEGWTGLEMYARMQEQGYQPNDVTFLAALKACASAAGSEEGKEIAGKAVKVTSLEFGRRIHRRAAETGVSKGCALGTSLVDMYSKCGSMEEAREVFDKLQPRSLVTWTAIMLGYVQNGEPNTALELFATMQDERCAPDALAIVAALKACSASAEMEKPSTVGGRLVRSVALQRGRMIHSQAAATGMVDLAVANTLIDMYAKCGSVGDARHVFEAMKKRSVVSWNCILTGCVNNGEAGLALELFRRMQKSSSSPPPDPVTFAAAIKACASLAALETGKQIEAEIFNAGQEGEIMVANALIDLYSKCGDMSRAERVFDAIPTKDVVSWSCLIAGYSSMGEAQRVFDMFKRMQAEEQLKPDGIIFLALLASCSSVGLADDAKDYFVSMQSVHAISPSLEHYNCVVDLLSRAGQLQDAAEIAKKISYNPSAA